MRRHQDENMRWRIIIFLTIIFSASFVSAQTCNKIDSCKCEMSDGSGLINLKGLSDDSGTDSQFSIPGEDGWLYKYNPCTSFTWSTYSGLAVTQTTQNGVTAFDLGTQNSAYFNTTPTGEVSIHYQALDSARNSRILLVCERGVNSHTLQFLGELIITEYDFMLLSQCSCPGLCDDNGIINLVEEKPTPGPNSPQDGVDVNVNNANSNSNDDVWTSVGGSMVALLFHDVFLVLVIAGVVVLIRHMGWCQKDTKSPSRGFGPDDVTGANGRLPGNGVATISEA